MTQNTVKLGRERWFYNLLRSCWGVSVNRNSRAAGAFVPVDPSSLDNLNNKNGLGVFGSGVFGLGVRHQNLLM